MERERHLLVVLAHPDDETFASGGAIAMHSQAGTPVTYVCATRGEMGRRMGIPPFATRESLRALREQELRGACAALGIGDLRLLGIWDKTVEFVDPEALSQRVGAVIAEVQPSLIISFHPVHGGHPDHNAIAAATIRAVAALPAAERPPVHCIKIPFNREELDLPVVEVDITPYMAAKQAAMAAHRSQSEGMLEQMEARLQGDPAALARFRHGWTHEQYWLYDFSRGGAGG